MGKGNKLDTALAIGVVGGLSGALGAGLLGEVDRVENRFAPNQGFWRSARNSARLGLALGVLGWLTGGLAGALVDGLRHGLVFNIGDGAGCSLFLGLSGSLSFGGLVCARQIALRLVVWHYGCMPSNYVHFLDYAADRILLRKVGGGYIFIHRMLQDYFVAQYNK